MEQTRIQRPAVRPRIWLFQPRITIMGMGGGTSRCVATQPHRLWIDALDYAALQIRVDVLQCTQYARLRLETSLSPEEEGDQWVQIKEYDAVPSPSPEILTLSSESLECGSSRQFARYIRWRAYGVNEINPWELCFRMMAIAGAAFSEWTAAPRLV